MGEFNGRRRPGNNNLKGEANNQKSVFGSVAVKENPENGQLAGSFRKSLLGRTFGNHFLAAQTEKTLGELLPFLELRLLSSEKCIYEPGDIVDFVYFPETAIISELRILESGAAVEIAMTGNEGGFGLLSLLSWHRVINRAQVLVPGSAYRISREILKNRMSADTELQEAILFHISEYIKQISKRAVCKNFHTVEQRFCSWLLMIQNRKRTMILRLTQEQISFCLGSLRHSVGVVARELKRKKIIDYSRGKLNILSTRELERLACDCHLEDTG